MSWIEVVRRDVRFVDELRYLTISCCDIARRSGLTNLVCCNQTDALSVIALDLSAYPSTHSVALELLNRRGGSIDREDAGASRFVGLFNAVRTGAACKFRLVKDLAFDGPHFFCDDVVVDIVVEL